MAAFLSFESQLPVSVLEGYRREGLWNDRRLRDGIEAAAKERPNALAVADNERALTHAELCAHVGGGLAALQARGVRPGDGVVLVAGNSAGAVVAYHALLRAVLQQVATDIAGTPASE